MTHQQLFLHLLSDDIRALYASALNLEKGIQRLSLEIDSHDIDSLAGLIAQINCEGFAPIDETMRSAGVRIDPSMGTGDAPLGMAVEADSFNVGKGRRPGAADAISALRRAARSMEMSCASIADSASRLRLTELAEQLRAWAREWIGLELNLNSVAARPRERVPVFAAA